jgi:hypothetical protein
MVLIMSPCLQSSAPAQGFVFSSSSRASFHPAKSGVPDQLAGMPLKARLRMWQEAAPRESLLETGRLVAILARSPEGLTKAELLEAVSDSSASLRSLRYLSALEIALNKRLQRARNRIRPYGLQICFYRTTLRWQLVLAEGACQDLIAADVANPKEGMARVLGTPLN